MTSAAIIETCPACGAALSPAGPQHPCVRCLLRLALEMGQAGSAAGSAQPPKYFGDYELIREIARGGMGVVWEARQISLNRVVALKLLLNGQFATESAIKRFEFEAEAAANLDHPNIVPIYEFGQHEGSPYLAMKLIRGPNLGQMMAEVKPSSPASAAALLAKIARAVHFAHLRGILHRDLKPSNILIDDAGEPHITDFGLAKGVTADGRLTLSGAILGSPYYMAPEQATGEGRQLSVAADIYSLGVILYESLTGRVPFSAESPVATLKMVLEAEPARPRNLNPAIAPDLETICLKCLHKDPGARYETAAALGQDLEHWLRHEPILARPVGLVERCWKWTRRHPLRAALAVVSLFAILGPLVTSFYLYHFVIPRQVRSHPTVGRDRSVGGFSLAFETGRVDRATMNFDTDSFKPRAFEVYSYFTNVSTEGRAFISNLQWVVMADIPAAPDEPRGKVTREGEHFVISRAHSRDRAYYVAPIGWKGEDVLKWGPDARLCIVLVEEKTVK